LGVIVPGYIKLFQECKSFGPRDHVFQKATAILVHGFISVSNTLELRKRQNRRDGIGELTGQKKEMVEVFQETQSQLGQDSPCNFMRSFVELIRVQQRPNQDLWKDVVPDLKPGNDVHGYFSHHPGFSRITTGWHWEIDIKSEDTNATDIFSWTPLHYSAVRGDGDVMSSQGSYPYTPRNFEGIYSTSR
jgi:hypothetical protein